jgi:hypothetical protein
MGRAIRYERAACVDARGAGSRGLPCLDAQLAITILYAFNSIERSDGLPKGNVLENGSDPRVLTKTHYVELGMHPAALTTANSCVHDARKSGCTDRS